MFNKAAKETLPGLSSLFFLPAIEKWSLAWMRVVALAPMTSWLTCEIADKTLFTYSLDKHITHE